MSQHSSKAGIYQKAGEVDGQPSWISSSSALWYNVKGLDWMIGSLEDIGKDHGGISSDGDKGIFSCPYNVPKDAWKYVNNASMQWEWIAADANDVSMECLTGTYY